MFAGYSTSVVTTVSPGERFSPLATVLTPSEVFFMKAISSGEQWSMSAASCRPLRISPYHFLRFAMEWADTSSRNSFITSLARLGIGETPAWLKKVKSSEMSIRSR